MAKNKRRTPQAPSASAARRLGNQGAAQPTSAGAQRRTARRKQTRRSNRTGWMAVGVVVVVVVALIIVKVTSGPSSAGPDPAGQHPPLAAASIVGPITTISATTFNAVGTAGDPAPFVVTQKQPVLGKKTMPELVYVGAEYCPYCALMRWSLVAALSRFGTFHNLKMTSSAASDGNIPTFSFLGATYTSPYLTFAPYEELDRNQQPLQTPPASVSKLFATYDGTTNSAGTAVAATPFNATGNVGIPFLDLGNKYVSSGDPTSLAAIVVNQVLENGGPGVQEIANAIAAPNSSVGKAISAASFVAESNYLTAAICNLDGGRPAAVCTSPGVKAAAKVLAAVKPVG